MKRYRGSRPRNGDALVEVDRRDGKGFVPLLPAVSLELFNHSPTGFEWGYNGSGPAQLALALLLDVTGNDEEALKYHQEFKFDIVGGLNPQGWEFPEEDIQTWLGWRKEAEARTRPQGPTNEERLEEAAC